MVLDLFEMAKTPHRWQSGEVVDDKLQLRAEVGRQLRAGALMLSAMPGGAERNQKMREQRLLTRVCGVVSIGLGVDATLSSIMNGVSREVYSFGSHAKIWSEDYKISIKSLGNNVIQHAIEGCEAQVGINALTDQQSPVAYELRGAQLLADQKQANVGAELEVTIHSAQAKGVIPSSYNLPAALQYIELNVK